jgi:hypothetical protein
LLLSGAGYAAGVMLECKMAHVRLLKDPNTKIRVCYFTDSAVGLGRQNHRQDVLLVQFLLKSLAGKVDPEIHETFAVPGAPPLGVDGICGQNTVDAIKRFQTFTIGKSNPNSPLVDGLVDVSPRGQPITTITHTTYTIILLNVNFGFFNGPDRHAALFKEPEFPNELMNAFYA